MAKMGRPPKDHSEAVLTKRATILFSPDDWAWLEKQAAINKQSAAAYIREMVFTARSEDER
jgi:hypothetical protein